ncbi:MAG: trans-isoprenyl diphosphate synthase [Deltaproteobacteria bacterium]|nr:trans-isoprenyl diphosphate synthase [Deltaproteobacteria bacterium]MBM2838392.1 trans-isoprenyl diphosphate synthase [Deltaproteobacteria bacterium]
MDIREYLKEKGKVVEEALDGYLPMESEMPVTLHKAMRYSMMAGGKRIRPILCIASCEAVGGKAKNAIPVACALEMVHTYSLIHDDLPAMDNDDLRRGRPTNHKIYGEAVAILAGDALLTEAFALLTDPNLRRAVRPNTILDVISDLARASGSFGMVGGQVVDMESEGMEIDLPTLEYLHTRKTGALILASIKGGAKIGEGTDEEIEALTRYGECLGLAFQIADDILDIEGSQDEIGKDVGSDLERKKATYPAILGMAESKKRARELMDMAIDSLEGFDQKAEPLREIAKYVVKRRS